MANEPETPRGTLTEPGHWDSIYRDASAVPASRPRRSGAFEPLWQYTRDYSDYLLWQSIYPRYLPIQSGVRVLEIGSAPGTFLVRLHQTFGYEPFGIDYSAAGARSNRAVFQANGLDPAHVFEVDLFDPGFQAAQRERFDLVFSRGFLEHFSDPAQVVRAHLAFLKPGGHLVVSIPNLRGINYALTRFLNRDLLALHNLKIMDLATFRALFPPASVRSLLCKHVGTLNLNIAYAPAGSRLRHLSTALNLTQRLCNAPLRLLFGDHGFDVPAISPSLLFIGQKR